MRSINSYKTKESNMKKQYKLSLLLTFTVCLQQSTLALTIEEYMPSASHSPSSTNARYGVYNKNSYTRGYQAEKTKNEPSPEKNNIAPQKTEGYQDTNPTDEPSAKEQYNTQSSSEYAPHLQTHTSQ